ncbi:phosphoenolpyruvate-protein phosphotransferase, partial [Vibrio parahaemolyticus V-223/04]
TTLLSTL